MGYLYSSHALFVLASVAGIGEARSDRSVKVVGMKTGDKLNQLTS